MNTVVAISILIGVITYSIFVVFCVVNLVRKVTGLALLLAGSVSLLWISVPLLPALRAYYLTLEPIAIAAWTTLLVRALGLRLVRKQPTTMRPILWIFSTALLAAAVALVASLRHAPGLTDIPLGLPFNLSMVVMNVLGLVMVEQLVQNSVVEFRWRLRYLNIGLGLMFAFGLVTHALAIITDGPVLVLVAIQPTVMAFVTPFVMAASLRNRTNKLRLSLSRTFVFRTGVLVSTGVFLLLLGAFGYLAELFAGDVGVALAVLVGVVALTFFVILVSSPRFRGQLRVQLSKAFFEYRYDYRFEWLRVTSQLTEPDADFDLSQQAQRAIISILQARQSCVWVRGDTDSFTPLTSIESPEWNLALPPALASEITRFYQEYDWVLDLNDMPVIADQIGREIQSSAVFSRASYLIPLFVEKDLFGICLIGRSDFPVRLSWEDIDVIKLISNQCAGFLALGQANRNLIETEQLSAVNQVSAFLLHDIKTIAAQLSLMLQNAEKHKHNPAFIDDVVTTTQNSVQRMERIIAALREPDDHDGLGAQDSIIDLVSMIASRSERAATGAPQPQYCFEAGTITAQANYDAVDTALTHLEQNARDAVGATGDVSVKLAIDGDWALIQVSDSGPGMSPDFIQNELFTPFRSTKGLSGMGIGAYQARDMVRRCGGDLQVESIIGVGTTFTIKLPLASA